jgi:hypothetical protein
MFDDMDETFIKYLPLVWRSDAVRLRRYYNFIADDGRRPRSLISAKHDADVLLQFSMALHWVATLSMRSGCINT